MKILLVEDDLTQSEYLVRGLREEGHLVDHVLGEGRDRLTGLEVGRRADRDRRVAGPRVWRPAALLQRLPVRSLEVRRGLQQRGADLLVVGGPQLSVL